jgi:Icc-related predicted phosphoesterase
LYHIDVKQLKCAVISDTHGKHQSVNLPDDLDILIHAGDFCNSGHSSEAIKFVQWFKSRKAKYKIFIAGNHDVCMERSLEKQMVLESIADDASVFYLEDGAVAIEGRIIYGSPWQPEFCNWAFNLPRGQALKEKWDLIPNSIDVLVTHGPPRSKLDLIPANYVRPGELPNIGCDDLLEAVNRVKPKFHVFGHIHYSAGRYLGKDTEFINAAICSESYWPVNDPQVFYI